MKFSAVKIAALILFFSEGALAQSVVPIEATAVIPTTAASPVVTSASTTTTTSTTIQPTMMDYYLNSVAAQQAAAANNAALQATATARGQQLSAMLNLAMQACPFFKEPEAPKASAAMSDISDALDGQNERMGNINDKELSPSDARSIGASRGDAVQAQGCDTFIDKDGNPGAQGRVALSVIRDNPDAFADKIPKDVKSKFCPNYPSMSKSQRELYWVWVGMSVSSPEASCNQDSKNPNARYGTAYGYFQLGTDYCKNMNIKTSGSNNTRCFYTKLADELRSRDSLTTAESGTTKWGTLRTDDSNPGRKVDVAAGQTARALMAQYPFCKGSVSDAPASDSSASAADGEVTSSERAPAGSEKKKKSKTKTKKSKQPQLI